MPNTTKTSQRAFLFYRWTKNNETPTAGHTQLPGGGVANVGSLAYLVGNPTSERSETATAHTGER